MFYAKLVIKQEQHYSNEVNTYENLRKKQKKV